MHKYSYIYTNIHADFIGLNVLENHNWDNALSEIFSINQMLLLSFLAVAGEKFRIQYV